MFWLASGYSLDFGLIGGGETGTFNQFIRGGSPLPRRRARRWRRRPDGKHFLLQESEPKEWRRGHRSAAVMPFSRPGNAGRGRGKPHARCHAPGRLQLRTLFLWCAARG